MDHTPITYSWYESYRSAVLETDKPKMRARLLQAEQEIVARLRNLVQDSGGTPEERTAIADALNSINNLRADANYWDRVSESGA